MDPFRHRVFVYGSLLRGLYNHHWLGAAIFEGSATTQPEFCMVKLGRYPGLLAGRSTIVGEVYRVDDAGLARLDELEAAPKLYQRKLRELADGSHAWIYELSEPALYKDCDIVENGDWSVVDPDEAIKR